MLQLCPGVLYCCQTLAVLSAVAAVLAGSQHPSCSCHGLFSSRTILGTGVRRGAAPMTPGALLGVCPAGGGVVQAPAFESHFVHLLSELLRYFSLSSALQGLRVYALEISVHSCMRVMLYRSTQKCVECFLAEVCVVYGDAFLLCPEIVISVLTGGRAGTDGICHCPASKLYFESVWVPLGPIFCCSEKNI